jgi:DHHC palmitoyltransferase
MANPSTTAPSSSPAATLPPPPPPAAPRGKQQQQQQQQSLAPSMSLAQQQTARKQPAQHQPPQGSQQQQQQRGPRRRVFAIGGTATGGAGIGSLWSRLFSGQPPPLQFQFRPNGRIIDTFVDGVQTLLEGFVYLLGPILICLALGICSLLTYGFFTILFPMMMEKHATKSIFHRTCILFLHCAVLFFILFNVLFNYYYCVTTSNSCSAVKNPAWHQVVRELATVTGNGFVYPETPAQVQAFRRDYEDLIVLRLRRRRARDAAEAAARSTYATVSPAASTTTATTTTNSDAVTRRKNTTTTQQESSSSSPQNSPTFLPLGSSSSSAPPQQQQQTPEQQAHPQQVQQQTQLPVIRRWQLTGPFEWGYCSNSHLPKPPRSHYDHVTKSLVLNLDHYCPWMFNSIGYFNYRYFVNFMMYIFLGMLYGVVITLEPFLWLQRPEYIAFRNAERSAGHELYPRPHVMLPRRSEKMMLTLCFMLCAAVGCAILVLGGFHVYLVLSAQTTIEFHGNFQAIFGRRSRNNSANGQAAKKFQNPYNQGWRRNWQQVYGDSLPWYLAVLPRKSEPEFLPVPFPGKDTKRHKFRSSGVADVKLPTYHNGRNGTGASTSLPPQEATASSETETLLGALENGKAGVI